MAELRRSLPILLTLLSIPALTLCAQQRDSSYSILIEAGAGYGLSKDSMAQTVARHGIAGTFRVLWKPDHLLSVGIETGLFRIASLQDDVVHNEFGTMKLRASLKAVPLMAVFDMRVWKLDVYTGLGYYYVFSTVAGEDEDLTNTRWNVGFYLSVAYKHPLADAVSLCGELKWCSIGELGKTILLAQVFVSYRLFEW